MSARNDRDNMRAAPPDLLKLQAAQDGKKSGALFIFVSEHCAMCWPLNWLSRP